MNKIKTRTHKTQRAEKILVRQNKRKKRNVKRIIIILVTNRTMIPIIVDGNIHTNDFLRSASVHECVKLYL